MCDKISYKQGFPYYKEMPCFVDGKRINSQPYIDEHGFLSAYYWRDAGAWGIKVSKTDSGLLVYNDESFPNLHLYEASPMSLEEWKENNVGYCFDATSVAEALTESGHLGHGGISIN